VDYSYLQVQLKDNIKQKLNGKYTNEVLFLHNNASAYRTLARQKNLAYLCFHYLDHTTYFPDLNPSEYHLIPALKKMKDSHLLSEAEVIAAVKPG
jgi:hypothetical protein